MKFGPKAALGAAALAGVLALGTSAHAYITLFAVGAEAKCTSAKIKTIAKGAAAYAGCYTKTPVDPACLTKASGKITAAYTKLDAKPPCLTTLDGVARDAATAAYALALDTAVGHTGKCDAAKTKSVGKYIAAIGGCYAKAAAKAPGTVGIGVGSCTGKALDKLTAGLAKIELKPPCATTGNAGPLTAVANFYLDTQVCALDPGNAGCPPPPCGNGTIDVGEDCDPGGGAATSCQNAANTGAAFTCSPTCTCACPTTIQFTGDETSPNSVLDTGWTGNGHRAPIISNGDTTISVSGCAGSSRPCGVCNVSGPITNAPGKLQTRRCSNAPQTICTSNANCSGGGTCEYFFGGPLSLVANGVGTCVINQFNGGVTGTANVETGDAQTTANLTARVFSGPTDNPCPKCVGDTTKNDGVQGGTCSAGDRLGLACDGNGEVFNRPDFGTTSLDCPPIGFPTAGAIATLPIDLSNTTGTKTKTLSGLNPTCGAEPTERCLCDTCNNGAAEPCSVDTDCPDPAGPIGPLCGGRRCIAGVNQGAACTNNTECPGSQCARRGEPSRASACLDDTTTAGVLDCTDTGPIDGEGECTQGPVDQQCSVASGHAQRPCFTDVDCGGAALSCGSAFRVCYLTGGFSGKNGTNTLIATGMADVPMNDTASPTLAAVFCIGPTSSGSVNTAAGLPGPGRVTIQGNAVGAP